MMQYDLIIKNGQCVTPSGIVACDVGVRAGKIAAMGDLSQASAKKTLDASNLHVLPGVIDSQVHFREPGNEHKEDLESGTRAAAMGGVTAIFEMPNTNPPTTTPEALQDKLKRASGRAWCDYAFFIGGTDLDSDWAALEQLPGCSGIKIFMGSSTGNLLVEEDERVSHILSQGYRRVAVHCEDEKRLKSRFHIAEEGAHPRFHPQWRDGESAYLATMRLLTMARATGRRVHVLHVTTGREMGLLAQYKDIATVECTPQHLTLDCEAYETIGTKAQMNPPIRSKVEQEALWHAINAGVVDVLGSDHAPHTLEEKAKPYPQSPSGMPGVQTLVPIMLNHVNAGRLTLERFVDLTAHGPARIYNIAGKGRLAVGFDADFTIVDMQAKRVIDDSQVQSRCGWTPYHGMEVQGWPTHTIIRGNIVMENDKLISQPCGAAVRFQDTLHAEDVRAKKLSTPKSANPSEAPVNSVTEPSASAAIKPASLGVRMMSILYDSFLLFAVLVLAGIAVVYWTRGEQSLAYQLYLLTVIYLYFGWQWRKGGKTLGMKTWYIEVQDARSGGRPTWGQTLLRFFAAIVSWLPLGLGFWLAAKDKEGRTWHDMFSETRLVQLPKPPKRKKGHH